MAEKDSISGSGSCFRLELKEIRRLSYGDTQGLSPMTNLAINLGDLNTSLDATPKRRLSLSSTDSMSPCRLYQLNFKDDGFYDSPAAPSSPKFVTKTKSDLSRFKSSISSEETISSPGSVASGKENAPRTSSWSSNGEDEIYDVDSTSRDSGFSDKESNFRFMEPKGFAPRRSRLYSSENLTLMSERRNSDFEDIVEDSRDDGFSDSELPSNNDVSQLPTGLFQLIEGKLPSPCVTRSPLGDRSVLDNASPKAKSCSRGLFVNANVEGRESDFHKKLGFKRPDPPRDLQSPIQNKRRRSLSFSFRKRQTSKEELLKVTEVPRKVVLQRCVSETEATIMKAVQRSDQEPNLIGDFTKQYILPLLQGKHQDLKSVSRDTVRDLLSGEYNKTIENSIIVDCRYPYEFDGGHIKGAVNIYTKETILQEFLYNPLTPRDANKRLVIIFHCEFSSERGPNLSRFLRNKDREANKDCYPHLHYPEIYLLEGGYKDFYDNHKSLCEPQEYKPMLHKDHEDDLRHFRTKSKSWNGDKENGRVSLRPGLKF